MKKLTRKDLDSLEQYAATRSDSRATVMEHKKSRRLPIGPHAALYFEDRLTIHYQIQEMLRAEKIFEPEGIEEELAVYNPLIPDGRNWKATFMLEYEDENERRRELARLIGIENLVWARVDGYEKVHAIADEDLDRTTDDKTSSVHFMRFELSEDMATAVKNGANIGFGIDHENYRHIIDPIPAHILESIANDID